MLPMWLLRLWRRPIRALAVTGGCVLLCVLMTVLSGYREKQQAELNDVKDKAEIICVVTNRRGTQSKGLRIGPSGLSAVTSPDAPLYPYIRAPRIVKDFLFSAPALSLIDASLFGVTDPRCAEPLDPSLGGGASVDPSFYESEDMICLLSEERAAMLSEPTFSAIVTDPYVDRRALPELGQGAVELTVVGTYPGAGDAVYIPFPAAMRLCDALAMQRTCDAITFTAADNRALADLRETASAYFGTIDPNAGEQATPRLALTVHDEAFAATVAALEQNVRRAQYLLPLLGVLTLLIGALLGFLCTRGERSAYALMRTLGLSRWRLLGAVLLEQLSLPLLGCLLTAGLFRNPRAAAVTFGLYLCGCVSAMLKTVAVPSNHLLKEQE